jgi:hypothetical protein
MVFLDIDGWLYDTLGMRYLKRKLLGDCGRRSRTEQGR